MSTSEMHQSIASQPESLHHQRRCTMDSAQAHEGHASPSNGMSRAMQQGNEYAGSIVIFDMAGGAIYGTVQLWTRLQGLVCKVDHLAERFDSLEAKFDRLNDKKLQATFDKLDGRIDSRGANMASNFLSELSSFLPSLSDLAATLSDLSSVLSTQINRATRQGLGDCFAADARSNLSRDCNKYNDWQDACLQSPQS